MCKTMRIEDLRVANTVIVLDYTGQNFNKYMLNISFMYAWWRPLIRRIESVAFSEIKKMNIIANSSQIFCYIDIKGYILSRTSSVYN